MSNDTPEVITVLPAKHTAADLAHRIGIWTGMIVLAVYVLNIGQWVGAADEKFSDAQTVEEKQDQLVLDVNTISVTQRTQTTAIEENKKAIEASRKEILAAIKEAHRDDDN